MDAVQLHAFTLKIFAEGDEDVACLIVCSRKSCIVRLQDQFQPTCHVHFY